MQNNFNNIYYKNSNIPKGNINNIKDRNNLI